MEGKRTWKCQQAWRSRVSEGRPVALACACVLGRCDERSVRPLSHYMLQVVAAAAATLIKQGTFREGLERPAQAMAHSPASPADRLTPRERVLPAKLLARLGAALAARLPKLPAWLCCRATRSAMVVAAAGSTRRAACMSARLLAGTVRSPVCAKPDLPHCAQLGAE